MDVSSYQGSCQGHIKKWNYVIFQCRWLKFFLAILHGMILIVTLQYPTLIIIVRAFFLVCSRTRSGRRMVNKVTKVELTKNQQTIIHLLFMLSLLKLKQTIMTISTPPVVALEQEARGLLL